MTYVDQLDAEWAEEASVARMSAAISGAAPRRTPPAHLGAHAGYGGGFGSPKSVALSPMSPAQSSGNRPSRTYL
jgi:hypothetical protein